LISEPTCAGNVFEPTTSYGSLTKMLAAVLGCPLRPMLSDFNRISNNWLCVKPSSPHAGGSSKICSICCFYATALLGLNHKQIRRPAITPAFGFLLRIIASGKYKWEYFYIGGCRDGDAEAGNLNGDGSGCIRRLRRFSPIKNNSRNSFCNS